MSVAHDAVGLEAVADEGSHGDAAMLDLSVAEPPDRLRGDIFADDAKRICAEERSRQWEDALGNACREEVMAGGEARTPEANDGVELLGESNHTGLVRDLGASDPRLLLVIDLNHCVGQIRGR